MNDIMEARRKGFEFSLNRDWREADANLTRHGEGYMVYAVDCAWWAWNAALDSVCVELPYPGHWSLDRDMIIEAIERAGLNVK